MRSFGNEGAGRPARTRPRRWWRIAPVALLVFAAAIGVGRAGPAKASGDPLFARQWNLAQIGAPEAWARSTGAGVRIGIVDTGILGAQEDLAGKLVAAADCIDTGGSPNACRGSGLDDSGHGTHLAGIAAASKDNGRGVAGVAPDATLVVARALTHEGGSILDVEAGIRWVVQHGAQVVNLSLGDNPRAQSPFNDLSFQAAVEEAWAAGAVPVVAAGNPNALGPGRENFAQLDALVVGATDSRGGVAPYSNTLGTSKWGLVAPGGSGTGDGRDILSTSWDPTTPASTNMYAFKAGASMSVAHVSGAVALVLAQGLSRDAAVERILATADPVACGAGCRGRLDAAGAVRPSPLAGKAVAGHANVPAGAGTRASPTTGPRGLRASASATATTPEATAGEQAAAGRGPEPAATAVNVAGRALPAGDATGRRDQEAAMWAAVVLVGAASGSLALTCVRRRPRA
jgi:serine protease